VLAITLAIMVALVALFLVFDGAYTSCLWYRSVGAGSVYRTRTITQISLFLVFGALMAVIVGGNIWLAHRFRPPLTGVSMEQQALDRYRMGLAPFLPWLLTGVSVMFGIAAGASASGSWRTYLMWADGVPFGAEDPQFHKDIGFYVFTLPWLRHIQGFLVAAVLLSLLAALLTHYLFAGVALTPPAGASAGRLLGSRATPAAQVHISVLLGCLVLVKAYAYWLDRYTLTVDPSKITSGWAGPTYKDVHAVLPAKTILLVIAVLCALLFFGNAVRLLVRAPVPDFDRGGHAWALPALGVSLMVLASVVIGGVYPLAVQQLQVNPSQGSKEAPYIQRNIDATRAAYGLAGVQPRRYEARTEVAQDLLAPDGRTVAQIPVMDPTAVSEAFDQQQGGARYGFPTSLSADRYQIGGKTQGTLIGVRGLKPVGTPTSPHKWVDDHLTYTHGFGVVAAKDDATLADGSPDYLEKGFSHIGALGSYEPRVYFGSGLPDYSIVGGPAKSAPVEYDYPDGASPTSQQSTTYVGKGGVPVGSLLNKLMYAVKFREPKILLSTAVNRDSRIMYDRDPGKRVQQVAPWLTIDGDTYPVVADGRILWVVDGYTTTAAYPYSTTTTQLGGKVNYVRNSVKATVDAYDGTVKLYAWDDSDPILKTWMKAFPGTVKPRTAMSPDLLAHLRYPQDLFTVQRDMLGRYHVTTAAEFSAGSSFWNVPADVKNGSPEGTTQQAPSYLMLQMPGQSAPAFSLASTLTSADPDNAAAFLAVDSDPGPDYGKITLLELPPGTVIPSAEQVENTFSSAFAGDLSGPKTIEGTLLTLPVGGGLLYVEPVYVPLNTQATYPVLKGVMAAFGSKHTFAPTLQAALDELFAGRSGATTGENPAPPGTPTTFPSPGSTAAEQLKQALAEAVAAQDKAAKAMAQSPPDWTTFGIAETEVQQALARAQAIENGQTPPTK
jgi:uncharacterized membrane protein (UPF0182 family)